jgi:transcriptional regulator with XRE-family HTH domain
MSSPSHCSGHEHRTRALARAAFSEYSDSRVHRTCLVPFFRTIVHFSMNQESPDVGGRVRALRAKRGLSLRKLSELCGLSINAISLIERGETSPTVSSLYLIANALSVRITEFFPATDETSAVFVPRESRLATTIGSVTMASLGYGLSHQQLEPFIVTLSGSGASEESEAIIHPGQEFVLCLQGRVLYRVGSSRYTLAKGDSLLFEATEPHSFSKTGRSPAKLLLILQSPDGTRVGRERHLSVSV